MNVPKHIPTLTSQHSESVNDELELLANVYLEDMEVIKETECTVLKFHVKPSTADDEDKQFVWLDLQLVLKKGYPHTKPGVTLLQSRGLSDAHLRSIQEDINHLSGEKLGSPMIFDLIEHTRGCLTDNNKPCGHCAVCQFTMEEDDVFVRTPCYHYFHQSCMAHYIKYFREEHERTTNPGSQQQKKLECPVCRVQLQDEDACVVGMENISLSTTTDADEGFCFEASKELRTWQAQMTAMLRRQQEKGGTIDLAKEVVIDDTWVSIPTVNVKDEIHTGSHDATPRNPDDSRPYSDNLRQRRSDLGTLDSSRDLERSGVSPSSEQGQPQGSDSRRPHPPPGFRNFHKGHGDSRRGSDRGDKGDDDHGIRHRCDENSSRVSKGYESRQRRGNRQHGDRELGHSHGDKDAGGSHGYREHGRQIAHRRYNSDNLSHGNSQRQTEDVEHEVVHAFDLKSEACTIKPQEAVRAQRRETGHLATKAFKQGEEHRKHTKPHLHTDPRRVNRHHHSHLPKKAGGKRPDSACQAPPCGDVADEDAAVSLCAHTPECLEIEREMQ